MKKVIKYLLIIIMPLFLACSSTAAGTESGQSAEMISLTNQKLPDALKQLRSLGFSDFQIEKEGEDWDENRLVVTSQNFEAGTVVDFDETIILTCKRLFTVELSVTSDTNLIFSKYDVDVLLDDNNLKTLSNGESFSKTVDAVEGEHTLFACKSEDEKKTDSYQFSIDGNAVLTCSVSHDSSGVKIHDVSLQVTPAEKKTAAARTAEKTVSSKPLSEDYKNAEEFKTVEIGQYTISIPSVWVDRDPYYYASYKGNSASVYYGISEAEGFTEDDLPQFISDLTENNSDITEVKENSKLYISRLKMAHAVYTEQISEDVAAEVTVYAFVDSSSGRVIHVMFSEPETSDYDYSDDFDRIIHSVKVNEEIQTAVTRLPEDIQISFTTDQLEYSDKETDLLQFVECNNEEVIFTTEDKINLLELGEHKIVYLAVLGDIEQKIEHTFTVNDTKAPTIKLESESVVLEYGKSYDPLSNITSVKDPVDGNLQQVNTEPKDNGDGWYYLKGKTDISDPGTYDYTVYACDKNGNRSSKSFSIKIKEEPEKPATYDYILNKNTKVFHYPDCRSVRQMKEKNKQYFYDVTREEMIKKGYKSCGNCNP